MKIVYDAGPLVATDRGDRRVWAEHRARLELGIVPLVPAAVVAQVSRSPRQAQLRRALRGCDIVALDEALAHAAGALLQKTRTTDVVDATVAALAAQHAPSDVVTSDLDDLSRLITATGARVRIVRT